MIETIKQLRALGWGVRRISRELGIHRTTVRNYLGDSSKCTISTTGSGREKVSMCTSVHFEKKVSVFLSFTQCPGASGLNLIKQLMM